jgi:hypothetical protein
MLVLPPIADMNLPPSMQERVICSISASAKYDVPANIVLAVAEIENGKPGQWVRNTNGTHDVGRMQFNTAYLKTLGRYGITATDVAAAGCYCYDLAAWRLRGHIRNDAGDLWTRAANYHSRTPRYNTEYRGLLEPKARKWATWLESRFTTVDMKTSTVTRAPAQQTEAPVRPAVQAVQTPAARPWRMPTNHVARTITAVAE